MGDVPGFVLNLVAKDLNSGSLKMDSLGDEWKTRLRDAGLIETPNPYPADFDPEVSDPSLQWKAQQDASLTPPALTPEQAHPFLWKVTTPLRNVFENPWVERAGQTGAEVATMVDNPSKTSTDNRFGDISADIVGGLMGFAENPASAGAKMFGGAERAIGGTIPLIPKAIPEIAQTGVRLGGASGAYEAANAMANDRPFDIGEAELAAGENALLGMLLHGGGKALESFRRTEEVPPIETPLTPAEPPPAATEAPAREFSSYRLPDTEQTAMNRLNEGIQEAQNYVRHNDILAAYPPGTSVEAALSDIKSNTGVDLPKLVSDVETARAKPGLRQQAADEAQFSRLGMAAGAIPQPAKLVGPGRQRIVGGKKVIEEVPPLSPIQQPAQTGLPLGVGAMRRIPEKMEPLANGQRVRSLGVSAAKAEGTPPEVQRGLLNEMVPGGQGAYNVHSNERTLEWADRIVKTNPVEAERFIRENPGTDLSNTVALKLVQKANAEGRFQDASDLIQQVSRQATTQGQAIQSLRLWGNMTPEGMQKYYVKTVENVNRDLEKRAGKMAEKLQVKPEIMEQIKTNMEKIGSMAEGRDKDIAIAQTLDLIASQVPVPFLRKVAAVQTMAQLLNPKTAIRNTVGNLGFAGLENVSGVVGAGIDAAINAGRKVLGKEGLRTKVLPSIGAQLKGGKQGWKHGLEDSLLGIDTSGIANKFDLPKGRVFRSGPMGFAEKALNIELRATDRAFYEAAKQESLLNQMRAAKTNVPTEEMQNIAHLDGLYRTFQDENALSNLFSGIKRLLNANKEFGIGDSILKYPKTPANLLMRGIDYSPAGFVKTILEAAAPLAKKQFNQKAFVESFSRAIVGSAFLFGTGALMHKLGIITGRPAEDKDLAELQREQGFGEYRINVSALKRLVFGDGNTKPQSGDKIISYDWFQPQAIPLAIGADVDANKGTAAGIVGTILQALGTGINAFADQPVVQGLQTLFSGQQGQMEQGLIKTLEGVPSSFVPTLLSQVKQLADNQRRETYNPNKTQESLNRAENKIPGMAGKLPQKYGTLGQPLETYQNGSNNPLNVFLNPAFTNTYNPSENVQKITDIYKQTGEVKQVPRVVPKKIVVSGKSFELTGQEYADYQKRVGELIDQGFGKIPGSIKPEEATKRMQAVMNDANEQAKMEILKARGENVYKKSGGLAVR